ncbi:MAG: 4-hydroxy-tetrahydrodipicolinate reductase, partial [Ruminococcaceae bacterium]|nr:4-hydroxy-tetrahydrodipicolinate reductase [Oscillospiraceae bacterium]
KGEKKYIYDRHNVRKPRDKEEIGISSIRGGTIVGEHDIIFAGHDEVITLSHSAQSREVFAVGAVNAAVFLKERSAGLYEMSDLLKQ